MKDAKTIERELEAYIARCEAVRRALAGDPQEQPRSRRGRPPRATTGQDGTAPKAA